MKKILLYFCAILLGLGAQLYSATPSKPNIVFILADDLAANAVGYSGNKEVITPNIDQLAQEGVRFMDHYDTTSICMASRCSIMTGLYEYHHGCNFKHKNLELSFMAQSYPVLLRQAGYNLGFAGKIGFELEGKEFDFFKTYFDQWAGGSKQTHYETANNPGIAKYAAQYPHSTRAYGAWAQDFLKAAKQNGKPFCLSISFKAPHMPFEPDPIDLKLYTKKTYTRPANYGVKNGEQLSPQAHTSRAALSYREWVTNYDGTIAPYYALITGLDAAVKMIRDELVRQDFDKNTVIIFTSDNGYNMGSHGFGDKVLPYEEASKAPLIIYDPRLPSNQNGKISHALTANTDLTPTLLALAGLPPLERADGKSLLPLLAEPQNSVRDFLPLYNMWGSSSAYSMAIVTPEWKYIYWYYGLGMKPTEELFQLESDPYEMKNAVSNPEFAKDLERMRQTYDQQVTSMAKTVNPGYQKYPMLFNRTIPWEKKAPYVKIKKKDENSSEE